MSRNLKNALASGTKIGDLTWYDCRSARVTPMKLKALFNKHNLADKHFPDSIKPKNAFQKACRQAQAKDSTTSDTRRSVCKIITDGIDKIVYGVVDLDINESQESIEPDFSDRVWLDKNNLTVHYDKGHFMSKKIKDLYQDLCGQYTTRDISRMIVKSMDRMYSVALRDAGVIYFVSSRFEKELHAIQSVVNDIGDCNMRVFEIGSSNASSVEVEARSQIQDKISKMKGDIAELKRSIEDGTIKGKTIENSIAVRLQRFRNLKERCSILADALSVKAESLRGDLETVGKLIKSELMAAA